MTRRIFVLLALVIFASSAARAERCGDATAAQCALWCGVENISSCSTNVSSYCIYHNRTFIECGYLRAVVTCTCIMDTGPHFGYETPSLTGHGFLIECENGVGFDEAGSAYCLPPESEP